MARIRSIKPEFWDDRKLARSTSRDARMLYMGLWNQSDEHGRLNGDVLWLKGRVFPYDDDITPGDVKTLLDELSQGSWVQMYEVDGDPYVYLPKLAKHQRLEPLKVESRIPAPPAQTDPRPRTDPNADKSEPRADKSAQDAEQSALLYVAGSMEHGACLPAADKSARGKRQPDELWDAIVQVCGIESSSLTKTSATLVGKVRRELAEVGATPEQVHGRARRYRARYRDADLTPTALVKHWASLSDPPPSEPKAYDPLASARPR